MPGPTKSQRIRDPLHNLIEFDSKQFERTLWQVIQTRPFQRLRRIRQLGFSELVFPGATHTRFAHSIGVFHTARKLMEIIKSKMGDNVDDTQLEVALAASLVHDVGHGMFSHSFEEVGKELALPMARHESVSEVLIRDGEIAEAFLPLGSCLPMARHESVSEVLIRDGEIAEAFLPLGSGFANDVANVLGRKEPATLYDSVVSSQFDADRLDYMQRDRLMTGVQSSGIDATWLISNLEIGTLRTGADEEASGTIDTLVVGPKAFRAAENYVLSLFQLYPNVYFHKTTRAAEKVFSQLIIRIFQLVRRGHKGKAGLAPNHPIRRFAEESGNIKNITALDDTVFWGALHMMADAKDPLIQKYAVQLRDRKLPKCIDLRRLLDERERTDIKFEERQARLTLACKNIVEQIRQQASARTADESQILIDETRREPYKKVKGQETGSPLNQIRIKHGESRFEDMARLSPVVASAETFEVCRAYHDEDDTEGRSMIENIIGTYWQSGEDG